MSWTKSGTENCKYERNGLIVKYYILGEKIEYDSIGIQQEGWNDYGN